MILKYQNRKTKLNKTCPLRFKPRPPVDTSRRLDHCTSALQTNCSKSASILHITKAGTSPRFWPIEPGKYTSNCRENKAGTIPRYSWEKSMSRELWRVNISFLQLVMFPTIARNITRLANAFFTVYFEAKKSNLPPNMILAIKNTYFFYFFIYIPCTI